MTRTGLEGPPPDSTALAGSLSAGKGAPDSSKSSKRFMSSAMGAASNSATVSNPIRWAAATLAKTSSPVESWMVMPSSMPAKTS
jgi:hypothetical protein